MTNNQTPAPRDPIILASMAALQRAAIMARKLAIQTETDLVIMQDGKMVRISAEELRREPLP